MPATACCSLSRSPPGPWPGHYSFTILLLFRILTVGGLLVLLAIKSDIIHEPITTPTQLEMTATKIHLNNNKHIIIAGIYQPPNSDLQYIDDMHM